MLEILKQARKSGDVITVVFNSGSHTGRISELHEEFVSLIVKDNFDAYTHQITSQTKANVLIKSISCVVVVTKTP
jgi:hypothetical protein